MRNFLIVSICFAGLLFGNTVFAKFFACPLQKPEEFTNIMGNESLATQNQCLGNNYQVTLANVIEKQQKTFSDTLSKLYHDNALNPADATQIAIQELRINDLCFEKICEIIVSSCTSQNEVKSAQTRQKDCEFKATQIHNQNVNTIKMVIRSNSTRKSLTPWREKFRENELKMSNYLISVFGAIVDNSIEFGSNLTHYLSN